MIAHVSAQRAARRDGAGARRLLGFLEVGQQLHAALVERAPALGQRQPARRAVEQARVEMRLEVGDVARDGRHRHVEPLGGAREAAGLDDPGEGGDGVEAVHGRAPTIIAYIRNNISSISLFISRSTRLNHPLRRAPSRALRSPEEHHERRTTDRHRRAAAAPLARHDVHRPRAAQVLRVHAARHRAVLRVARPARRARLRRRSPPSSSAACC